MLSNLLLCGIYNGQAVPISIQADNRIAMTENARITGNRESATSELSILICGIYRSSVLPILVSGEGELIL